VCAIFWVQWNIGRAPIGADCIGGDRLELQKSCGEYPVEKDRIRVVPTDYHVSACIPEQGLVRRGAGHSIVVVDGALPDTSPKSSWQRLWEKLTSLKDEEQEPEYRERVEAMARGGESKRLAIPLLSSSTPQTVVAGTRPFRLTWIGGSEPFSVVINGPSGGEELKVPVSAARVVTATMHLREGPYEVRVTDASGHSVVGAFEVTSAPPALDQRRIDSAPAEVRGAVAAAILAGVDDGAWRLEAYERLSAEPSDRTAQVVAGQLTQGRSLADLRKAMPPGH